MKNLKSLLHTFHFPFFRKKTIDEQRIINEVVDQAKRMCLAFQERDFETFLNLTHPRIIELNGGRENMKIMLEKGLGNNVEFVKVELVKPSKLLRKGSLLQCSLIQKQEVRIQQKKVYSLSSLIAISYNLGKSWYFIGVANSDIQTLKKYLPELSDQLQVFPTKTSTS